MGLQDGIEGLEGNEAIIASPKERDHLLDIACDIIGTDKAAVRLSQPLGRKVPARDARDVNQAGMLRI